MNGRKAAFENGSNSFLLNKRVLPRPSMRGGIRRGCGVGCRAAGQFVSCDYFILLFYIERRQKGRDLSCMCISLSQQPATIFRVYNRSQKMSSFHPRHISAAESPFSPERRREGAQNPFASPWELCHNRDTYKRTARPPESARGNAVPPRWAARPVGFLVPWQRLARRVSVS